MGQIDLNALKYLSHKEIFELAWQIFELAYGKYDGLKKKHIIYCLFCTVTGIRWSPQKNTIY